MPYTLCPISRRLEPIVLPYALYGYTYTLCDYALSHPP